MTIQRIRLPDEATAEAISRGLWLLSRPVDVATQQDGTTHYCDWGSDEKGAWIEVDDAWRLPIHAQVAARLADAKDTAGSRAQLAALLTPIARDAGALGRELAALTKGGALAVATMLAEVDPARVVQEARA